MLLLCVLNVYIQGLSVEFYLTYENIFWMFMCTEFNQNFKKEKKKHTKNKHCDAFYAVQ